MIMYSRYDRNVQEFNSVTGEMVRTYERKNQDYGDSFSRMVNEYGYIYPIIHLEEKLARIRTLLLSDKAPAVTGEEATDSLLDLACYAVMTIVVLRRDKAHKPEEGAAG